MNDKVCAGCPAGSESVRMAIHAIPTLRRRSALDREAHGQ